MNVAGQLQVHDLKKLPYDHCEEHPYPCEAFSALAWVTITDGIRRQWDVALIAGASTGSSSYRLECYVIHLPDDTQKRDYE